MAPRHPTPPIYTGHGFWGEPTATIDWCEWNYRTTLYVAEFWNTLSSFWIIIPPIFGILEARRHAYESRELAAYVCLIFIGVGSVLFHMTLKYEMQLLDEVPMIYGTAVMGYMLCEIRKPAGKPNWRLAAFLVSWCLLFTVTYLTFKNPYIHETMFLLMVFSIVVLALRFALSASNESGSEDQVGGGDGRKKKSPVPNVLIGLGLLCYTLGGIVWNLDNHICRHLTRLREREDLLPTPLSPATQLHAWWHFFSGYGTYLLVVAFTGIRQKFLKRDFDVGFNLVGPVIIPKTANSKMESKHNDNEDISKDEEVLKGGEVMSASANGLLIKRDSSKSPNKTKQY